MAIINITDKTPIKNPIQNLLDRFSLYLSFLLILKNPPSSI